MDRTPDRPADGLTHPATRSPAAADDAAHDAARAAADAQRTGGQAGVEGAGFGGTSTKAGNTAAGVGAGVVAGTMAGIQAGALGGAVLVGVGGLAGAVMGAMAGAALAQESDPTRYTAEVDAHYRALYDGAPAAGRGYDQVRAAYVFGHLAAGRPELAGLGFDEAEPSLREAWNDELRAQAGEWPQVRRHVLDAYGHARAEGAGERRVAGGVGSGASAVDPVELDRAQHGLPSTTGDQGVPGLPGTSGGL